MTTPGRHGPQLPYRLLAGVEPCPAGWVVAIGKLQGASLSADPPQVFTTFIEVLDYKPAFEVIALHAPIGLPATHEKGGRSCDQEARKLLQWPRSGDIQSAPTREMLVASVGGGSGSGSGGASAAASYDDGSGLSVVQQRQLRHIIEVDKEMEPYRQRTVYEVNPELGFYELNAGVPMRWSKHTRAGEEERRALLLRRIPGIDRVLTIELEKVKGSHLCDAAIDLWTARRIAGRNVVRLPEDPEWDDKGLRMELVR